MNYNIKANNFLYLLNRFPLLISARIAVIAALSILAFLLFNYAVAGPVRIKNVIMYDDQHGQHLTVSLPLQIASQTKGDIYHFTLDVPNDWVDPIFPLHFSPFGCIRDANVNGTAFPLKAMKPTELCYVVQDINVHDLKLSPSSSNQLTLTVRDMGGMFGLQAKRLSILSSFQQILLLILAAYLLSLASIKHSRQCGSLHYYWFVALFFIVPLLFAGHEREWWWIAYLANGLAVAFLAYLGTLWAPTQRLYLYLSQLLTTCSDIPPRVFIPVCMGMFFLLTSSLSQILYDGLPHIADSHVQYIQSKIMAAGKLYEQSHPLRQFFNLENAVNDGKYYSITFPGHPFLLAIGQLFGVPWLVNPVMGALTVWAVFLLARELGGKSVAYIAVALMLVSPAVIFMSSEYMNHASCMFFLTLFLYSYIRLCKTGNWRFAVLAGCTVGAALLIRVQSTVPFALPVALHAIWNFARHPKTHLLRSSLLLGSFGVFALILLYYNYVTTGDPWHMAYLNFKRNQKIMGFAHADQWAHISDDLFRFLEQVMKLHRELFGWPTSSLWMVFYLLFFLTLPPYVFLLFWVVAAQMLALVFIFPDNGAVMPPRYIYESFASLIVLTALGLQMTTIKIIKSPVFAMQARYVKGGVCCAVLSLVMLAFPYRINDMYRQYANNYWQGNWGYYYMLTHSVEEPALIFIHPYESYILIAFNLPPKDDSPIIFAQDLKLENKKLMDYYPGRHVYMVDGWSVQKVR